MNNEILNQNQSNQNGNKNIIDLKLTNDELRQFLIIMKKKY